MDDVFIFLNHDHVIRQLLSFVPEYRFSEETASIPRHRIRGGKNQSDLLDDEDLNEEDHIEAVDGYATDLFHHQIDENRIVFQHAN
ncbi:MAG: hypothetical protein P8J89_06135 [Phycisphaerales bacterium]|nr:hypothetical protein [Phycisphaerales bacterium]